MEEGKDEERKRWKDGGREGGKERVGVEWGLRKDC